MRFPRWVVGLAFLGFASLASVASARVISYAPYSDRISYPAVQQRTTRHFAAVEGSTALYYQPGILISPAPPYSYASEYGQVVVYDSTGAEEPRVVFPQDDTNTSFTMVAMRENGDTPVILLNTNYNFNKANPSAAGIFILSNDGGRTWKQVPLPSAFVTQLAFLDIGGPVARQYTSPVRIGTASTPFLVAIPERGVYSVSTDGAVKLLIAAAPNNPGYPRLAGTSRDGSRALVHLTPDTLVTADLAGNVTAPVKIEPAFLVEGWITSTGGIYALLNTPSAGRRLFYIESQTATLVSGSLVSGSVPLAPPVSGFIDYSTFFAVPTASYDGAWMIQRGTGKPTTLLLHTRTGGLATQWSDVSGPEVEALIAGGSGTSVLVQVHRSRPQADQRLFKDPALAVWHVGEPAPRAYDELYLNENTNKGFVHVDVDRIAAGEPFVFDSGAAPPYNPVVIISPAPTPPAGGGSDVVQEWGIVRASLSQRLVLPGISRTQGGYGSYWLSDVIIHNPVDAKQNVTIRYVPTGSGPVIQAIFEKTLTLEPHEIRVIKDALKSLFQLESGGGAFFITPEAGVDVTSRTYSQSASGTYGFGMNGIDVYAAASARFPVSFSGALQGPNFRTNVILTDVGGHGSENELRVAGNSGAFGFGNVLWSAPPSGQDQINGVSSMLGVLPSDTGALLIRPTRGYTVASVFTIDNRTNDPTYFPPDLPAPFVRTIPAIGHLDGANNAKYRSDLFLYNPSNEARQVTLQVTMWDGSIAPQTLTLTLIPNEARVLRDVLFNAFGKTGIARLRYVSQAPDNVGVRVTSRTYSTDENGGTYGFLMPPLNNFQIASPGDSLEILGAIGDAKFRTNIGLVELSSGFTSGKPVQARIDVIDHTGKQIDSFTVNVPFAGGMQINDLFHARNLGDGPPAALIRISPLDGMIGAYGTLNDNGTNDPTYLAAQLAAKQ